MNRREAGTILFFFTLALAQRLLEPAYAGYMVVFAFLAGARLANNRFNILRPPSTTVWLFLALWSLVIATVTYQNEPASRDVARDIGAFVAFLVGRYLVVRTQHDSITVLLSGLSGIGIVIAAATVVAAAMAYAAGADAYVWRGTFVPYAHTWIPYILVANYALIDLRPDRAKVYARRMAYCVVGTLASLSRTDLLLEAIFFFALLVKHRGAIWDNRRNRRLLVVALAAGLFLLPSFFGLDVVQQRVELGVGQDDMSLGWRLMENLALLDHFAAAEWWQWLLGFGLGARVPLPVGVVDFSDNTSIPHLHNSFLTIMLKVGGLGLLVLIIFISRQWWRSRRHAGARFEAQRVVGRWTMLFVLAKAVTLHGLTEWSHILFFGVACALMESGLHARWFVARPVELMRLRSTPAGAGPSQ